MACSPFNSLQGGRFRHERSMLRAGAVESRERIKSVDGLRALAFLLVFAFHSWEFAGKPFVPVISGIVSQNTRPDFFVVLTGFVLFLPFARDPDRARSFVPKSYLTRIRE